MAALLCAGHPASASDGSLTSWDQVAPAEEQAETEAVEKYGMLPIYGRDVRDGTYEVEVTSSSRMFRITHAELTVSGNSMEAVITLSGTGYRMLYMGTGQEAAESDGSSFVEYAEDENGMYTYTIPVEALDRPLDCAAFSIRKEQWYDRVILFNASSLPADALLVELPDYDRIEAALAAWDETAAQEAETQAQTGIENKTETETELETEEVKTEAQTEKAKAETETEKAKTETETEETKPETETLTDTLGDAPSSGPMPVSLEDDEYAIEVILAGGSGKSTVVSPTILLIEDGCAWARLQWSSSNYDYMIVDGEKYLNLSEEGAYSVFQIPVTCMDAPMEVIADTTAMGTPHEIAYTLTFYSDTIGPKSQLPQEAAKRVVAVALAIIVGGGILNHVMNKKRRG